MNMRMGSCAAQNRDENRPENSFANFYTAATLGGAKALGRDDLGKLAAGAKADIIIIDLDGYHMGTVDDPIRTIGLCASGRDVKTSIINGRVVMENRVIPGLDIETMKNKAQNYYDKLKKTYVMRNAYRMCEDELYPSSFKIVHN